MDCDLPFTLTGLASSAQVPLIAHVPHGGIRIPRDVRERLALDDGALEREIVRMTDWHTGALFACAAQLGGVVFENCLSRLVVDPERFPDDDQELMARVGLGAVYLRTCDGAELRRGLTKEERQDLLTRFFWLHQRPHGTRVATSGPLRGV
jgi:N-formylglutamate amidohydrolase